MSSVIPVLVFVFLLSMITERAVAGRQPLDTGGGGSTVTISSSSSGSGRKMIKRRPRSLAASQVAPASTMNPSIIINKATSEQQQQQLEGAASAEESPQNILLLDGKQLSFLDATRPQLDSPMARANDQRTGANLMAAESDNKRSLVPARHHRALFGSGKNSMSAERREALMMLLLEEISKLNVDTNYNSAEQTTDNNGRQDNNGLFLVDQTTSPGINRLRGRSALSSPAASSAVVDSSHIAPFNRQQQEQIQPASSPMALANRALGGSTNIPKRAPNRHTACYFNAISCF